jgi:hypothetical protein
MTLKGVFDPANGEDEWDELHLFLRTVARGHRLVQVTILVEDDERKDT